MKSFQIPKHNHINAMQYQYSVFCRVALQTENVLLATDIVVHFKIHFLNHEKMF